ncbi:hypothetical protein PVK06_047252 [Gossypium arboreum]|uniref:Uncharacterized protein n=1 Tax=Gossypium arboreum TaxID=29729 RepID=A0ABR0MDC2_GOSAR|nr:hypothetical protein PVK06_047252 [Gossypium arboreum]
MDFEGKQGREELPVSPEHEMVQETVVKVSLPTLGNNNLELGTEALTRLVSRKRDRSPLKQKPHSVKRVKTRPNFLA